MASLNPISGTLGAQNAAHLLRRATLGPTLADIQTFSNLTPAAAFQQLIQVQPTPDLPIDYLSGTDWVYPNTKHPDRFTNTLVILQVLGGLKTCVFLALISPIVWFGFTTRIFL